VTHEFGVVVEGDGSEEVGGEASRSPSWTVRTTSDLVSVF
jgi:hypothetical protein